MLASRQPTLERSPRFGLPIPSASLEAPSFHPTLDSLEELAVTVSFSKDDEIYAQGDSAVHCFRILRGCVRTVKLMEDGRRQVNEFLLPGDWFGMEALDEHDFAAEAVDAVMLRRYPRRGLDALAARDPGVSRWLLDLATRQLRRARDRMVSLGRETASERIAGFLLEMLRRMPHDRSDGIGLPMSRGDIADHLGLTIETVCRCLAQLRRDGTIALTRSSLTVRDRTALLGLASATRH
jgi:CRP/FNR family nitrogen fixation transcriptional regulator